VVERVFYPADRIPFVEWSALSGARPAVVLTGAVALLAFVTGLSNLSQPMTTLSGPLTAVVDVPPTAVQFGGVLFAFVLSGVTVGSYGLRSQFLELDTWSDAVYYVLVTVATVGYGDITPVTAEARWFSLSIIVFGTGAFTVAVGALIGPAIESRMTKAFGVMTASDLTLLEDHIVILGHGDLTESLLDELTDETELVVVSPDQSAMARLDDEDINLLTGDPSDESVLEDAGVERARGVIVSSNDDARDVLAVIATKNVAPEVRTVAAATENKYVEKFRSVGVDAVLNPRSIGGRLLSRSVLTDESPDALVEWTDEDI